VGRGLRLQIMRLSEESREKLLWESTVDGGKMSLHYHYSHSLLVFQA